MSTSITIPQGQGLAEVAAQLAELESLDTLAITSKWTADKEAESKAGVYGPKEIAASQAAHLFSNVQRRANAITETLKDLVLQLEPQTLDEVLSLALVYNTAMAHFFHDLIEDHDFVMPEAMRDRDLMLDRARQALIRGLIKGAGAKSPLTEAYACEEEELIPWAELRRKAEEAAKRYPPKADKADKEASQ